MRARIPNGNLLEGPFLKNILLFSVPIIISSILQLLFNAADVIVVGRFAGETELAAVGSNGAAINLIVNLCIGLSIGANVLVARYIGARDRAGIERAVHTAVFISIVSGLLAGVAMFFLAEGLLSLLDTPDAILNSAVSYLRAYAVGIPASIIYNFGTAILRAKGDTMRPLYILIIAGIVNVVLNLILVIGFHLGAVGVGIATAAAQFISAALVFLCLIHEESEVRLVPSRVRLCKEEAITMVKIGLPAGIQSSLFSISNMLIQSSINSFGSTAIVAGNAAAANIEGFVYVAMNAIYQTMLTLTGQNLGARQFDRIDKGLRVAALTAAVIGAALGGIVVLFDEALLSIYSTEPEVIRYGCQRFLYIAMPYFLVGLMETTMGTVRGLGYSILPMCVSLLGACAFRVLWVLTVFQHHHTIGWLFISYPISWILTGTAHFICYRIVRKKVYAKYAHLN